MSILKAAIERISQKDHLIVAVDGRCGSGKTYQTNLLAEETACRVIRMDDFYLPMDQRRPDWQTFPAGNIDIDRFLREILIPLRDGTLSSYRPYSCKTGEYGDEIILRGAPLTVIEGSYCMYPSLAPFYDCKIFLTCSQKTQRRRLQAREGERFGVFLERWIPMEERYFAHFSVPSSADVVLATDDE